MGRKLALIMEGANRLALVIVGWTLPIINFFVLRQAIYSLIPHSGHSLLIFNILSCVVGALIVLLFFGFAIDTPIEAICISSVLMVMIFAMRSRTQEVEQLRQKIAHRRALQAQHLTPIPAKKTSKQSPSN